MRNYFKFLIYYFLCIFDGLVNFLSCIVGYYPGVQIAEDFLFEIEYKKTGNIISNREDTREQGAKEAEKDMRSAKTTLENIEIYGKGH